MTVSASVQLNQDANVCAFLPRLNVKMLYQYKSPLSTLILVSGQIT